MLLTDEGAASGLIDQAVAAGRPVWFFRCDNTAELLSHPVFSGPMVSMHFFGASPKLFHGVNPLRGLSAEQVRLWAAEMVQCFAFDCFFEEADPDRVLLHQPEHQKAISCFLDEWVGEFFLRTSLNEGRDVEGLMEVASDQEFMASMQGLPVFHQGLSAQAASIALRSAFSHSCGGWFSSGQEVSSLPSLIDLGGHVLLSLPYGLGRSPMSVQFANFIIASLSIQGQHLPEDKGPLIITSNPYSVLSGSRMASALTRIPGAALVHCLESGVPSHVERMEAFLGEQTNFTCVVKRFKKSGYRFCELGGKSRRLEVPVTQWHSRQELAASPDLGPRCLAHRQARDLQAQTAPVQALPAVRRI